MREPYAWQEKWKFPGTLSISKNPFILHPFLLFMSLTILAIFSSSFMCLSLYYSFSGIVIFFRLSSTLTKCTFKIFYTSSERKEQGYLGKAMSICTFNFWARCFWSIIRSLSVFTSQNSRIDMVQRKSRRLIETTEMHAPETVPSLY